MFVSSRGCSFAACAAEMTMEHNLDDVVTVPFLLPELTLNLQQLWNHWKSLLRPATASPHRIPHVETKRFQDRVYHMSDFGEYVPPGGGHPPETDEAGGGSGDDDDDPGPAIAGVKKRARGSLARHHDCRGQCWSGPCSTKMGRPIGSCDSGI